MKVTDPIIKTTVALIETYYWKYKRIATDEELFREYLLETDVNLVKANVELVRYLADQGVPIDGTVTLTPRQVRWIDVLCSANDPRPLTFKLKDFGLSLATHNKWLKNPLFQSALQSRVESILPDERVRVHQALARESAGGNVTAIKLYLTLTGELIEQGSGSKEETASLMQGILEILESHVSSTTLLALAEDFDYLLVHGVVPIKRRPIRATQPELLEPPTGGILDLDAPEVRP
jgi:Helix-turn-helix of insertion element transposase